MFKGNNTKVLDENSTTNIDDSTISDDVQDINIKNKKKDKKEKIKKKKKGNSETLRDQLLEYEKQSNASKLWQYRLIGIGLIVLFSFSLRLITIDELVALKDHIVMSLSIMAGSMSVTEAPVEYTKFSYLSYIMPIVCIGLVGFVVFTAMPSIMSSIKQNRYEEQKFQDTTTYVEQMLYSFRRNSKIIASLKDTYVIFPAGEFRDTIQSAIDYIQTAETEGNVYEEAFEIIEKKYNCRRVKSLHKYMMKVEGLGGNHDMGVSALINDRRLWIDRIDEFKKIKADILKEIIVATIFSSIVVTITMAMLPDTVGFAKNIIVRSYSTIYIIANILNVKVAFKRLILYLNDIETKEQEKAMVKKLRWYKNFDIKTERKKSMKPGIMFTACAILGLILKQPVIAVLCLIMGAFAVFVQPALKYRNAKKTIITEIETVYPDWLLGLSLLLQTDNLHVALEKTIPTAPLILKDDLKLLADKIAMYPTEIEPYAEFFDYLPISSVHSSMKLLYSISEFGSSDEEKQISELIERNSSLMNKAEINKNNSRLSRVFILKFVPMGTSAVKLIIDMAVFIVLFLVNVMGNV